MTTQPSNFERNILTGLGVVAGILVILFLPHSSALYVGGIVIATALAYGAKKGP